MSTVDTATVAVHLIVAAVWVGSVVFTAVAVLPLARAGTFDAGPLESLTGRLSTLSRASTVLVFLSGAHLAMTRYTGTTLFESTRGHLVLGMVGLWVVFTGLVEVGNGRLRDGFAEKKVREPADAALPLYRAATAVGLFLLGIASVLTA